MTCPKVMPMPTRARIPFPVSICQGPSPFHNSTRAICFPNQGTAAGRGQATPRLINKLVFNHFAEVWLTLKSCPYFTSIAQWARGEVYTCEITTTIKARNISITSQSLLPLPVLLLFIIVCGGVYVLRILNIIKSTLLANVKYTIQYCHL